MFKQLKWLLKNPNIIKRYKYLEQVHNKLKTENHSLKLKLHNIINKNRSLKQILYNTNNENKYLNQRICNIKQSISQENYYKRKYNQLNKLILKIKKVNNLKENTSLDYEIKNKLNMYNIYKNAYYSKNPILDNMDSNNSKNYKTCNDISHFNFKFFIKNPMIYSENVINENFNKINNNTHLLKTYIKILRFKNYDKFTKLLFNTPKKPAGIFYNYVNTVKQKENGFHKNNYRHLNQHSNYGKIDYTSITKNSYFVSISANNFHSNYAYYDNYHQFQYIFNSEKNIIVFEVIRRMLLDSDNKSNGISRNRILNIIRNIKFKISTNKYITYPFYNGNNSNDYMIHDTKHNINLSNDYVPYNRLEIENEMKYIDNLTGHQFENYISDLLRKLGYENVKTTQASNDYGLDNIGYNRNIKYGFQCKHYKSSVGYRAISELVSGCKLYKANHGIVITNSKFSKNAIKAAKNMNVILWDREILKKKILDSGK